MDQKAERAIGRIDETVTSLFFAAEKIFDLLNCRGVVAADALQTKLPPPKNASTVVTSDKLYKHTTMEGTDSWFPSFNNVKSSPRGRSPASPSSNRVVLQTEKSATTNTGISNTEREKALFIVSSCSNTPKTRTPKNGKKNKKHRKGDKEKSEAKKARKLPVEPTQASDRQTSDKNDAQNDKAEKKNKETKKSSKKSKKRHASKKKSGKDEEGASSSEVEVELEHRGDRGPKAPSYSAEKMPQVSVKYVTSYMKKQEVGRAVNVFKQGRQSVDTAVDTKPVDLQLKYEVGCDDAGKPIELPAFVTVSPGDEKGWYKVHYVIKKLDGKTLLDLTTEIQGDTTRNLKANS